MSKSVCISKLMLFISALLFTLILGLSAYAEVDVNLPPTQALNIVETAAEYTIYARVCMIGECADDLITENKTYATTFLEGVIEKWSGEYEGKKVTVKLINTAEDTTAQKIRVYFAKAKDKNDICNTVKVKNSIYMYVDDYSMDLYKRYSYNGFKTVAAHEFGHILGLGDVYSDSNDYLRDNLKSIMRSWYNNKATYADYYILFKHQTWELDKCYAYSLDVNLSTYADIKLRNRGAKCG